ncbi:MAG TPA: type II toxin-antitoxin system RelE/ParE family toxin [Rhizomicrobium sp.]
MIRSFRCQDTARIWSGIPVRKFPSDIHQRALNKLRLLDAALTVNDLRNPPGNRPEALRGERKGEYSIRVTDQWRICFKWNAGDVTDVEIVDYH